MSINIYKEKKEKKIFTNKYISTFIFDAPLEIVWNILKNPSLIHNFNSNEIYFGKNNYSSQTLKFSYEIGTKFNLFFNSSQFIYHIENIIETDYFNQIHWICYQNNNFLPPVKCIFTLYYYNEKTLFTSEYYFPKYYNYLRLKEDEKNRQKYYNSIQKYIINYDYLKYFILSLDIEGDFNIACLLFDNIKTISNINCDVVKYNSNLFIEKNELEFKFKNSNLYNGEDVIVKATLGQIEQNKEKHRKIYEMFLDTRGSKLRVIIDIKKNVKNNFNLSISHLFYQGLNETMNNFWRFNTGKFILKVAKIFNKK